MTTDGSEPEDLDALEDQLRPVLEEHPVRLAVLFGSTVRGDRHPQSDVDLAVEFEPDVEVDLDTRLSLWADLSIALGRDDVDVAVVDDLDPSVGRAVFEEGVLVVGSEERFSDHRCRFDRLAEREDSRPPGERFDDAIEALERVIGG